MAHAFNHQTGQREERTRAAFREIGISVTSGFITTASSSLALVLCDFQIFLRLGQFLIMTLCSSWCITMFLMMALLASVGPSEGEGNIPMLSQCVHGELHLFDLDSAEVAPDVEVEMVALPEVEEGKVEDGKVEDGK